MRKLRRIVLSSCVVALIAGCQRTSPDDVADTSLVITSADLTTGIEARYREGDHALILRSRPEGTVIKSDIVDERGRSVSSLATSIVERTEMRTPQGQLAVPVPALFENATKLTAALQLSKHGIRQLHDAIPAGAADSAMFKHLSQQTVLLRNALRQTRLALLQEWGSEARRHITMSPEEHKKFFAILHRQAAVIAAKPTTMKARSLAATPTTSIDDDIEALLGPERYAQYQTRRKAWLAPAGEHALEVVP